MFNSIHNAQILWNEAGMPYSEAFEDIYFSTEDGLAETRYVFIQQNSLAQRWPEHDRTFFTIGETGFGTGLNFLATWQAFRAYRQQHPGGNTRQLHFISTEKYPLTRQDLRQALTAWPELAELSKLLTEAYTPATEAGCLHLLFDQGTVILDVWLGDVLDTLPELPLPGDGLMDAWFLDGFAPSKNPDMWCDALFQQLFRLCRPMGTLATFTCAGLVRRGLTAAGFVMAKRVGFGKKREMLTGYHP